MDQSTCAPSSNTSTRDSLAPLHTEVATLRSVALPPRPPFPEPPTRTIPLGHDVSFNRGAYDEAYDRFQHPDRYDRHAAWDAFGEGR